MRQILNTLLILVLLVLNSCGFKNTKDKQPIEKEPYMSIFDKYSNDSIRTINFQIAYNNKSTAPNYIVFKAKDLNSGLTKEICSEAPFLSGAMHKELRIQFDTKGIEFIDSIILNNRQKVFEFKNEEALNNIDFSEYPDSNRIIEIAKGLDLDYYFKKFGRNNTPELKHFEFDTGFVQLTFTHIMFKCGILTRRDCIAGNNIYFGNPLDFK